jgi:hypothetical protein
VTRKLPRCYWCRKGTQSGHPVVFCDSCREELATVCRSVAKNVWQRIPWDLRIPREVQDHIAQYTDTRFLFECDPRFQFQARQVRRALLHQDGLLKIDDLTRSEAVDVIGMYAPSRRVEEWDWASAREIIDFHVAPWGEFFLDRLRSYYAEYADSKYPLTEVERLIKADLADWLPNGLGFILSLVLADVAHAPPGQVFKYCLFGEPAVEESWLVQEAPGFPPITTRPQRTPGPYLGRFPASRWSKLGLGTYLPNLVRLWTCFSLEQHRIYSTIGDRIMGYLGVPPASVFRR